MILGMMRERGSEGESHEERGEEEEERARHLSRVAPRSAGRSSVGRASSKVSQSDVLTALEETSGPSAPSSASQDVSHTRG
ncbi:hypothetical protein EYF80_056025 [Liparis tanakae]|uniref:Uncharacterized protein n=1 Tax=Liparis tanakae TaxID=230148 RepID=A0A4Z2EZ57_9TELE|nr:hypothetical protein EYF80_056025 [Liparis tanakae]